MPGVHTRASLRRAGWDDARLMREVRAGHLVRVGFDRYADSSPCPLELIAAAPGSRTALCSLSAARAWGLPADNGGISVVVPHGARRRRLPAGVSVRRSRSWAAIERDGVLLTNLTRTLADVARERPLQESVPVLDAGLRMGAQPAEILAEAGRAYAGRARRALALADGRAESRLESLLRLTLTLAGLPPEDLQHEVREAGRFVARVDLWYDGLVVEADGFAFHRERDDYRRDRRKGQAFARLGLLVLRFSWEDITVAPDRVVATVRCALEHRMSTPDGWPRAA